MKQYTGVQIGLGSRGIIHIDGMNNNPDMFKVIGYCNRSEANLLAAKEILDICNEAGIKTILCHQHKYLRSFMKLKEILR